MPKSGKSQFDAVPAYSSCLETGKGSVLVGMTDQDPKLSLGVG